MRELHGNWRDLLLGFKLAFEPRKLTFALIGLIFSVVVVGVITTAWCELLVPGHKVFVTEESGKVATRLPVSLAPHHFYAWFSDRWWGFPYGPGKVPGIFDGSVLVWGSYLAVALLALFGIWAYFGGAIARSAAYQIAREGDGLSARQAMQFAAKRFWSFFSAPIVCALGFLLFYLVTFLFGLIFRVLDFIGVGSPLAALFAPLAILAGFLMALLLLGTFTSFPLFLPSVAVEGTDAFAAFSGGFSYVFARPWRYLAYQFLTGALGYLAFVYVFVMAVLMTWLGLSAGAAGFELAGVWPAGDGSFHRVNQWAFSWVLSPDHQPSALPENYWTLKGFRESPDLAGRPFALANLIVQPDFKTPLPTGFSSWLAAMILIAWLVLLFATVYAFPIAYFFCQQTMIYLILRKQVDEIEMKEIFVEDEEEALEPPVSAVEKSESPKPPEPQKT